MTVPNDLAEALKGETDVIVAKDAEEEALEAALFGGELELGGSGGWTGLNDDSDDGAPEEFGISQTLFTIDTKGNEREKVQIKEKGHVKFDYGEGEEEESDEEDGEKDGQRSEPEDSDVENNNDALSSEASDSDSSVSEAPAPLERKPAWTDSTDAHHTIDLNDRKITRKLRTNLDESTVSLNEYENRLRRQFDKIHGTKPEWALTQTERAELLGVKRRTTTTSSDEEEEEEEQQGIENLLSTAGGLLNKARRGLEKGRIGMRRMRDANWMAVSEVG